MDVFPRQINPIPVELQENKSMLRLGTSATSIKPGIFHHCWEESLDRCLPPKKRRRTETNKQVNRIYDEEKDRVLLPNIALIKPLLPTPDAFMTAVLWQPLPPGRPLSPAPRLPLIQPQQEQMPIETFDHPI